MLAENGNLLPTGTVNLLNSDLYYENVSVGQTETVLNNRGVIMKKILVVNGPNLNLLGEREPGIYGSESYTALCSLIMEKAKESDAECEMFQSNHEGEIIDKLHAARKEYCGVILNAGAYTHYSYAIRDAISAIKIPVVEVHISNIAARDEFRKNSVIAPVCCGSIAGFGFAGYLMALDFLIKYSEDCVEHE